MTRTHTQRRPQQRPNAAIVAAAHAARIPQRREDHDLYEAAMEAAWQARADIIDAAWAAYRQTVDAADADYDRAVITARAASAQRMVDGPPAAPPLPQRQPQAARATGEQPRAQTGPQPQVQA